jgi:hypothetical protein
MHCLQLVLLLKRRPQVMHERRRVKGTVRPAGELFIVLIEPALKDDCLLQHLPHLHDEFKST